MLPAAHRLRGDTQFRNIIKNSRAVHGEFFLLRYARTANLPARVAFVVSNKVAKTIVVRNKLKRRMRAIVARGLPLILPAHDILIVAKKGATQLTYTELNDELREVFSKARLLKNT